MTIDLEDVQDERDAEYCSSENSERVVWDISVVVSYCDLEVQRDLPVNYWSIVFTIWTRPVHLVRTDH